MKAGGNCPMWNYESILLFQNFESSLSLPSSFSPWPFLFIVTLKFYKLADKLVHLPSLQKNSLQNQEVLKTIVFGWCLTNSISLDKKLKSSLRTISKNI